GGRLACRADRARAQVDADDREPTACELQRMASVAAANVEDARARRQLEPLDDEVDLARRALLVERARDLVEPVLLEEPVVPVRPGFGHLHGSDGEVVHDPREYRGVDSQPSERGACAPRGLVGYTPCAVDALREDVAVAVEDVVDRLEERA